MNRSQTWMHRAHRRERERQRDSSKKKEDGKTENNTIDICCIHTVETFRKCVYAAPRRGGRPAKLNQEIKKNTIYRNQWPNKLVLWHISFVMIYFSYPWIKPIPDKLTAVASRWTGQRIIFKLRLCIHSFIHFVQSQRTRISCMKFKQNPDTIQVQYMENAVKQ